MRAVTVLHAVVSRHWLVLVVCGAGLALRTHVAFSSYFWQDDFNYLSSARQSGLSLDYLLQDISGNGHIMPATFLVAWFVTAVDAAPHVVVAAIIVALQAASITAMVWVVRQVTTDTWGLVAIAAFAFTPLGLVNVSWWSFAMQGLSLQVSVLVAIGAMTAHLRTRQWVWGALQVAAVAFGLLFWEKALIVPFVALVCVTCFEAARHGRARLAPWLRQSWRLWVANLLVSAVYFAVYVTRSATAPQVLRSVDWGELLLNALPRNLLPGLFGGPWSAVGDEETLMPLPQVWVQVLAVGGVIVLLVLTWHRARWPAILAWVPGLVVLAVDIVLVATQRAEWATTFMRDPRYFVDAIPVLLLACVVALSLGEPGADGRTAPKSDRTTALACTAFITLSCAITTTAMLPSHRHQFSRSFVETYVASARQQPGTVLADAPVPVTDVLVGRASVIASAFDLPVSFEPTAGSLSMVDGFGQIVPAQLPYPEGQRRGAVEDCGWRVGRSAGVTVPLPTRPGRHNRVVRVQYEVEGVEPVLTEVSLSGAEPQQLQTTETQGSLYFQSTRPVGEVGIEVLEGEGICVTSITVGEPWPAPR